jgi:hypothetical protein
MSSSDAHSPRNGRPSLRAATCAKNTVNDGEDGGCGSDAEGQHEYSCCRKSGGLAQLPEDQSQVENDPGHKFLEIGLAVELYLKAGMDLA